VYFTGDQIRSIHQFSAQDEEITDGRTGRQENRYDI
jgi:hypothetical protein